jgi:uncharacterized membrane protein
MNAALFSIRFQVSEFYPMIRRKHLTMIDVFSYGGGLLGLFFGISVLSIVEFVLYFLLTFRRLKVAPLPVIKVTDTEARSVWKSTKHYCLHYLQKSSIHSFLLIGDSNKKAIERLVWVLTFALSIIACVFMIQKLRQKSNINSITTVIVDGGYDITKIPFPAVTIFSSYPVPPLHGHYELNYFDGLPYSKEDEDHMEMTHYAIWYSFEMN